MLRTIVSAGMDVEMQSVDKNLGQTEEEGNKIYKTKVLEVLSGDSLEILMPMEKSKLILLPIEENYNLSFYTEKGLYQCFAKVVDRYKSNNVYVVVLELTSNLRKHQRREFYRFSCALEMKSRMLEMKEVLAVEKKEALVVPGLPLKRSVVVDISGGGLRFIANHRYEVDSLIYCNYKLFLKDGPKEYHLVGKVLAVKEVETRPGTYEHRVQYQNMDLDVREEIIRFIFEEERKQRHKDKK